MYECNRPIRRRGVTLVEVMFALGTLMIGLLGLAAVIPVAASFARNTLELDRGAAIAAERVAEGVGREAFKAKNLVVVNEIDPAGYPFWLGTQPRSGSGSIRTNHVNLDANSVVAATAPIVGTRPLFEILDSPGCPMGRRLDWKPGQPTTPPPVRYGAFAGYCFDPSMLAVCEPEMHVNNSRNAYTASRFPYYNERANALNAPNDAISPVSPGSRLWRVQPRYFRDTVGVSTHRISQKLHSVHTQLGMSSDDLVFSGLDSAPAELRSVPRQNYFTDGTNLLQRSSRGEYSWIATLTPQYHSPLYNLAIVVIKNRALVPHSNVTNGSPLSYSSYTRTQDNPTNERVVYCDPLSVIGFANGFGGTVTVKGSTAISDEIKVGEWVMLSRQEPIWHAPTLHRWYQVTRVSKAVADPSLTDVWNREVTLSGPDFPFITGIVPPIAGVTVAEDTSATGAHRTEMTIIDGAIAVKQYPFVSLK